MFYFPYANAKSHAKVRRDQLIVYQIKPELINEDWSYIRRQTRNETLDGPILEVDEFDFL